MADNVQLQGIEFEIVGESEKAAGGIKTLTSSLKKLQSVSGKGLGLEKIKAEIKDLNDSIGDTSSGGLVNLATSLSDIANASRKLGNVHDKLKGISDLDFSNLQTAAQAIGAIADTAGWRRGGSGGSGNGNGNVIPTDLPANIPETEHVDGSTQAIEEVAQAEEKAASAGKDVRQALVNVVSQLGKGAVNARKFAMRLAAMPFKKLAQHIKNTVAPIKQFVSSIGRIALYRAIRGLISGITQSLKEGIKNLYEYSRAVGTTFHNAMNVAATDVQWLKNSLAAAVAPIVESLMPAFDALATKIATALNLLAQFMAILSGRSTYTKAIKSAKEYGAATGGAAKELRMLISGFDELNAFPDKSGGGGGADYSGMFEEANVDSELSDFAKRLKEAFEKGDWEGLGKLLGDKVNEIFDKIQWRKIGQKLGKKIDAVIRTAYSFLKTVNFKNIGRDIAELMNGIFESVNFETAGRLFIRKITALLDFIIGWIEGLDWDLAAKAIGDFFKGAFREAAEWLRDTDFAEIGRTISQGVIKILDALLEAVREIDWFAFGKAIGDFLANIDWLGILSRVAEIVWEVFKGVVSGLLSTSGGRMFLFLFTAVKGLRLAFTLTEELWKVAVQRWVLTGISPLQSMPAMITEIGGSIKAALAGIAKFIGTAALGVFDAVMIAYDVKSLASAAQTYNDAQLAHNHETETALNSYSRLYQEKGKEVADEWANMVYQIDTTNMNFDQAQQALTQKIEGYWDGVPQNMWEGFKQGWNSYFGEGGSGLFSLLSDAFTSAVKGIKDLLGIHSPSTVFFDMGVDLVTGLFNGITSVWNTVSSFFTEAFTGLKTTVQQTWTNIQQFTTQTWTNIKTTMVNLFTNARSNIVSNLNTLRSNMISTWNSAKTATVSAWTAMTTSARQKFIEIHNTVRTSMNNATSFLRSIEWRSIGSNLVNGLLNGLKSAWNAVTSWVSSAASTLTNTLRNAFRIHSPSKLWAEIGTYLDLGLQEGLESGTGNLLTTAGKIANALTGAMTPTLPSPATVAAGMSYGVNVRPISGGYEDYAEDDGSVSGIASVLEQMFEFMRTADQGNNRETKIIIDGREVFNVVVNENNRAIQRTGVSPIRV